MRRRLPRHGARPLRPPRPAGGAAHRVRCLPGRLARQQPAEGGPQLRPRRPRACRWTRPRSPRCRRPPSCSGSSTTTSSTTAWAAASDGAGVHINDPGKGRRFVPMEDFDTSFTGVVLVMEPGPRLPHGRPQARRPGRHAGPAARHLGHDARRACWRACCWSRSARRVPALSRTYIDMFLIGGQTSLLRRAVRVDGRAAWRSPSC